MSSMAQQPLSPQSVGPPCSPSRQRQRSNTLRRMPSAKVAVSSYASPLARLEAKGRIVQSQDELTRASASSTEPSNAFQTREDSPPVPALTFNLFRHNSVLSIDSLASDYTMAGRSDEDEDEPESPTTPRASTSNSFLGDSVDFGRPPFAALDTKLPLSASDKTLASLASDTTASQSCPPATKMSFTVSSQPMPSMSQPQPAAAPVSFKFEPVPPRRTRSISGSNAHVQEVPAVVHPEERELSDEWTSVHGEQGSDWGDDKSQFEWVETEGLPEVENGIDGKGGVRGLSPTKRLSRLKTVMGKEGGKLRKPMVIPRRAPPPPPSGASAPAPLMRSPSSSKVPSSPSKGALWRMAKQTSHPVISGRTSKGHQQLATFSSSRPPLMMNQRRSASQQNDDFLVSSHVRGQSHHSPLMVPLRNDCSSSPLGKSLGSRQSHMSSMSGFSFYDLDSDSSPATPKAGVSEFAFPKGKYTKVPVSVLEREGEIRERAMSEPVSENPITPLSLSCWSADDLVHRGIEARGKGDFPKSAYYFMKAAEAGSSTGRIYWGLALRHGWGVGIDNRRAFIELRKACDESLAEGGVTFHNSLGHQTLTIQQRRFMTNDLAMGMFEVGNCFLEGIGVKKAPDVALRYMRFAANLGDVQAQEQLGQILSKGGHGIKKNMKEAAKWYRMAITQGSNNTVGLSWVWKDKYMS
ncbi:hypothetical protein L204_106173 [Cryptococcus depauperatus]